MNDMGSAMQPVQEPAAAVQPAMTVPAVSPEQQVAKPGRVGVTWLLLLVIRGYQRFVSPLTPPSCRFYPTCSHYTYQAIERYGLWRGGWLGVCRVCKCHPFHAGGYDPVPEKGTGPHQGPGLEEVSATNVNN